MKKMKSGFTLAEVLITLGIIGVVAAIVMPSVMTNYTYKTVGVKLQKFLSQVESTSRPFVVTNEQFVAGAVATVDDYIADSFLIINPNSNTVEIDCSSNKPDPNNEGSYTMGNKCGSSTDEKYKPSDSWTQSAKINLTADLALDSDSYPIAKLKDGTEFVTYMIPNYDESASPEIVTSQVGEVVFGLAFAPKVNGLPKSAQKAYQFVVTELGYVYPDRTDDCMNAIATANYAVKSSFYKDDAVCSNVTTSKNN